MSQVVSKARFVASRRLVIGVKHLESGCGQRRQTKESWGFLVCILLKIGTVVCSEDWVWVWACAWRLGLGLSLSFPFQPVGTRRPRSGH